MGTNYILEKIMNKIKLKYLKIKWLKQFKKLIKNQSNDYYKNSLSKLYDFDTETSLFSISFFDTVNNRELNKLIKKIHEIINNQPVWQKYVKEMSDMEPIVKKYKEYKLYSSTIRLYW